MELCDGGTVTDLVAFLHQNGLSTLREDEIAYILQEVNHALVYLHEHNTLHRDVKGSNIVSYILTNSFKVVRMMRLVASYLFFN